MATLSGNKIKDTYQSLVKFSDNGNITTSAKQLTDGFGNNSPMYVSTTQVGIGVTPESGLNLHVYGDAKIGSNLTVIGNLVVEGSTTTVGTDTLTVKDPLIVLANNNTSTDAVDIGFYGKYTPSGTTLYSGLFREALTGKYRLFKDLQEEPTTTVNTSGTGYAVATLIANLEGNVTGNLIGSVTGGTFSGTLLSNVVATTQSAGDNSTKVATTAYVDNQVGLYDTLSEVLANGNTSGANDIIMADSQKVNYGTGSDLQIYHDATDSYIKNDTGNLIIEQTTDDADIIFKNDNGSGDTIEYFRIDGSESRIVYGRSIHMADNVSIFLGNDDDGLIRYDSTANKILYTGTSQFSGNVDFQGNINLGDNNKIILGVGDDLEIYSDGTDNYITQSSGTDLIFTIDSTEMMRIQSGGDISINESNPLNSSKFYVKGFGYSTNAWAVGTSTGTFVGQITSSASKLQIKSEENNDIQIGDATSLNIIHIDTSEDSVGINLTNPADYTADELVISVPDGSGMTLVSGSTDAAYIEFKDSTGAIGVNGGFISYNHDTDTLTNFAQSKVSIAILEAEVAYFTDTAFYVDKSTTIDDTLTVNGNVGINETSPASSRFTNSSSRILDISGNAVNRGGVITLRTSDNSKEAFLANDAGLLQIGTYTNNDVTLYTNNIERMRIDSSGNVLIGSTSFNTGGLSGTAKGLNVSSVTPIVLLHESDTDKDGYIGIAGSTMFIQTADAIPMRFGTNDTERMRIDSSGIVRIFTTGGTSEKTYSAAAGLELYSQQSDASVPYTKTSDIVANGDGTVPSELRMFTKANGSSTPTERMRIDSSGNVGIGTTSPKTSLDIFEDADIWHLMVGGGTKKLLIGGQGTNGITIQGGAASTPNNAAVTTPYNISLQRDGGNVGIGTTSPERTLHINSSNVQVAALIESTNTTSAQLNFKNGSTTNNGGFIKTTGDNIILTANNTSATHLVVASGGNVGIGTDDPDYLLHLEKSGTIMAQLKATDSNQAYMKFVNSTTGDGAFTDGLLFGLDNDESAVLWNYEATALRFATSGTERMRITSGGIVEAKSGFSATNGTGFVNVRDNGDGAVLSSESVGKTIGMCSGTNYASAANHAFIKLTGGTSGTIDIRNNINGVQLSRNATAWTSLSDENLKENIKPLENVLDKIKDYRCVEYNFKTDNDKKIGFIAQDWENDFTQIIHKNDEGLLGMKYTETIPVLLKAIQELKAEIELLKTQINN